VVEYEKRTEIVGHALSLIQKMWIRTSVQSHLPPPVFKARSRRAASLFDALAALIKARTSPRSSI